MKAIGYVFGAALVTLFSVASAQAVVIRNISGEPQTLVIEQLGSAQEITLPAGGSYQRQGVGIIIHREGQSRPLIAHQDGEYAIWPDGDLHIQRYRKFRSGQD